MALVGAHGLQLAELAHVDHLVGRARRERRVVAPVDVERGRRVERELLPRAARRRVPDDRRLVHAGRQDQRALLVPLEREDRSFTMLSITTQIRSRTYITRNQNIYCTCMSMSVRVLNYFRTDNEFIY